MIVSNNFGSNNLKDKNWALVIEYIIDIIITISGYRI